MRLIYFTIFGDEEWMLAFCFFFSNFVSFFDNYWPLHCYEGIYDQRGNPELTVSIIVFQEEIERLLRIYVCLESKPRTSVGGHDEPRPCIDSVPDQRGLALDLERRAVCCKAWLGVEPQPGRLWGQRPGGRRRCRYWTDEAWTCLHLEDEDQQDGRGRRARLSDLVGAIYHGLIVPEYCDWMTCLARKGFLCLVWLWSFVFFLP
jgi:hypothetical protein